MFNLNLFSMFLNIWSRAVLLFTAFILDPMTTDPNVFNLRCFMPFDDSISDDVWDYEIMKFSRNEAGHGSPWAGQSFIANNLLHGWIRVTRPCHHCQWRCILHLLHILHLHDHRQVATGRQPKVSPTRSWRKLSAFTSSFRWRIMMMAMIIVMIVMMTMIIVMIMTIICRSQTYVQHLRRQVKSHSGLLYLKLFFRIIKILSMGSKCNVFLYPGPVGSIMGSTHARAARASSNERSE